MDSKSCFTLAEVLVTLAIIGVVAALTIPTVMHKIQNQELYAKFISTYNIFENVFMLMKNDGLIARGTPKEEVFNYLKYTSKCNTDDTNCDSSNIFYKNLRGRTYPEHTMHKAKYVNRLPNGAEFEIKTPAGVNGIAGICIDTNGTEKGPNVLGRDFFYIFFHATQDHPVFEHPIYLNGTSNAVTEKLIINDENIDYYCNPEVSNSYSGSSCGLKMIRDHKMDY